jgi:[ribosomal protein S18]-alanine N-acetyltransferase
MSSSPVSEQQRILRIRIEPPRAEDLRAVIELQTASGLTPWPPADFERELSAPDNIMLVAVAGGPRGREVKGFFAGRLVADEFEIYDVVVAVGARRQGVGAALLGAALAAAGGRGAASAHLEVRAGNGAAIGLYQRFGFTAAGVRKAYYRHPPEDALLMSRNALGADKRGW